MDCKLQITMMSLMMDIELGLSFELGLAFERCYLCCIFMD